jgi:hypothetical protein
VVSGWVIYRPQLSGGGPGGPLAVCEQEEWDAMESAEPGRHALLRSGIASEAEAESLARGMQAAPTGQAPPKRR